MLPPIDNKTTQKVKEAVGRMNKNAMKCTSVILDPESTKPTTITGTTIARLLPVVAGFKSGKTEYMCDGGKVVLLVNYWEPSEPTEQTNSQCLMFGLVYHSATPSSDINNMLNILTPPGHYNEELCDVPSEINAAYGYPVQLGMRIVYTNSAFKEADLVVQRFYENMRQIGIIQDEPEEDMGALAEAAGFEW